VLLSTKFFKALSCCGQTSWGIERSQVKVIGNGSVKIVVGSYLGYISTSNENQNAGQSTLHVLLDTCEQQKCELFEIVTPHPNWTIRLGTVRHAAGNITSLTFSSIYLFDKTLCAITL